MTEETLYKYKRDPYYIAMEKFLMEKGMTRRQIAWAYEKSMLSTLEANKELMHHPSDIIEDETDRTMMILSFIRRQNPGFSREFGDFIETRNRATIDRYKAGKRAE